MDRIRCQALFSDQPGSSSAAMLYGKPTEPTGRTPIHHTTPHQTRGHAYQKQAGSPKLVLAR